MFRCDPGSLSSRFQLSVRRKDLLPAAFEIDNERFGPPQYVCFFALSWYGTINLIVLAIIVIVWWANNVWMPLELPETPGVFVVSFFLPLIVAVAVALLVSVLFWPFVGIMVWNKIHPFLATGFGKCCGVLVLTLLGIALYIVRSTMRTFYGAAETIVGVAVCGAGMRHIDNDAITSVFAFASGVYVIVRGLDNFFDGRKRSRERGNAAASHPE